MLYPQTGSIAGPIRTASREAWVMMEELVREIVSSLLAPLQVQYSVHYRRGVPPVVNVHAVTTGPRRVIAPAAVGTVLPSRSW